MNTRYGRTSFIKCVSPVKNGCKMTTVNVLGNTTLWLNSVECDVELRSIFVSESTGRYTESSDRG